MNNMDTYYLGIDSSTTATKAILIDGKGRILGVAASEYDYQTPHPLWSEQGPQLWWTAAVDSIRQVVQAAGVDAQQVAGIGLTGQMHGLVIMDEAGQVLRPAILWNDQRTQKQCDFIRAEIGKAEFIAITGNDALTGFTAPKILWVRDEEPHIFRQIRHVLLPKDYLRLKLTGEYAVDRAGGSGTVLFDLKKRDWSDDLIQRLGLQRDWFPPTFEGTGVTGSLNKAAADETGLREDIPVFGGGGDQSAAAVGTGAVEEGILSISLGTSGVVFATTDSPFIEQEGRLHAFCHAVPGKWHLMGVMLSAAGSLRWFRETFCPQLSYDQIVSQAVQTPKGSQGLLFMPYLTGERTPYPDPLARGGFVGATVRHGFGEFARAVLEGVAFGLRDSYELMRASGLKEIDHVRITGGGAKNPQWLQIIADVLNTSIYTVDSKEGAAFGAAVLAASGAGAFPSVSAACQQVVHRVDEVKPTADAAAYDALYARYRELYPALKDTFHRAPLAEA
ncbi:MAG: xylulokinase [Chloroflexota bacterium]|nr:xylulokinase [Chloroflexota bacterium]